MYSRPSVAMFAVLTLAALGVAAGAGAHTRGNHAGDWSPGQEVKVCVCPPPDGKDLSAAIEGAIAVWNDSKDFTAGLHGLKFTWHASILDCDNPPAECDVTLNWSPGDAWGSVSPSTMPVPVQVEPNGGLDSRGVQRVLMHELGHVKGLGHSALSAIMRWNYRGAGSSSPSAADLNGADAFETPNNDDNALNKLLHGAPEPPKSKSTASGMAEDLGGVFRYSYQLDALGGPGFLEPVTSFTIELPRQITSPTMVNVVQIPPGWNCLVFPAEPYSGGMKLDRQEDLQKAVAAFFATSPGFGIPPGGSAQFAFLCPIPPGTQRAYTNSPGADTDEFLLAGPTASIPSASPWGLLLIGALVAIGGLTAVRRFAPSA